MPSALPPEERARRALGPPAVRIKRCACCGIVKKAEAFNRRNLSATRLDSYCRPCRTSYMTDYVAAGKRRRYPPPPTD